MAVRTRKRYRLGGDFSVTDADGFPRHFFLGDELPREVLAKLNAREIKALIGNGMLREIGAPPPPKPAPQPPRRFTAEEVLRANSWWRASVEDGRVTNGPRGYTITVLDRAAQERDLELAAEIDPHHTEVVVHRVGVANVATIRLERLASLLALAQAGPRG